MTTLSKSLRDTLRWNNDDGVGYFPVDEYLKENNLPEPYNERYFDKYVEYEKTPLGQEITVQRTSFVNYHHTGLVCDVGIGSGHFIKNRPNTVGFDINIAGINWLNNRGLFHNLYSQKVDALTFWDSLEHIKDPKEVLGRAVKYVFVSIPIFRDYKHVLSSKHFRPDEHYHYFTDLGFTSFMWNCGFKKLLSSDFETALGREDIKTYAFKRK